MYCYCCSSRDLNKKFTVEVKVDQLNSFAYACEVTRVAHEVGTEGKLGVQAQAQGVNGSWKFLTVKLTKCYNTDNVNIMIAELSCQLRDITKVTKTISYGDLFRLMTVTVKGEIGEINDTINTVFNNNNRYR
ncbi:hypothetical protein Glove_433g20 [Diversispora epigaea]|uniref:Uncharacterized protein n=1 Tax=Diversispora epigaea TaxID=1348612 RepID=A0A397H0K1_9GLOM|nr:hypothetical protein Glove_433g20 [Diversispora epigaea]